MPESALSRQRGVALVVVLVLLLVITLLGVASVRGVLMEERMSANMYDRSLAFQGAEMALREAEAKVREATSAGLSIGVDCASAGKLCLSEPEAGVAWTAVSGSAGHSSLLAGAPEYYIEYMGEYPVVAEDAGAGRSAANMQYGAPPPTFGKSIYRVTARSHDPRQTGRAAVTLQSTIELR